MRSSAWVLIFLSAVPASLIGTAYGQEHKKDPLQMIARSAGLSSEETSKLGTGEVVVKTLKTSNKQETSVIGIVRISGISEVSPKRLRDSLSQPNGSLTPGGRFSSPPDLADLDGLEFSQKDIEELAKCRIGNCDFNLSAEAISRFEHAKSESQAEFDQIAPRSFREAMLGYLNGYIRSGDVGLPENANRRGVVNLAKAHSELLNNSGLLRELSPSLYSYLSRFPQNDPGIVESAFFWSTAEFGFKPMITLSHVATVEERTDLGTVLAVATKQIYASRYLDASLNFAVLVPSEALGSFYLVFADRSRSDVFGGLLGGLARTAVEAEATNRVRKLLVNAAENLSAPADPITDVDERQESGETADSSKDLVSTNWLLWFGVGLVLFGVGAWAIRHIRKRPNG